MSDPVMAAPLRGSDPLANHRILVIDDNASIHEDYRKILLPSRDTAALADMETELFGETSSAVEQRPAFELTSAMQGQDGHRLVVESLAVNRPFALAFIDMRMPPGWDGMETTLRILQEDPDIQVVICTAYADYTWEDMSRRLGATDRVLILKKPFDNIEVIQLAMALCRKWLLSRIAKNRMEILESLVHKRVEELADSNSRLSTLIMVSPVGIFVLDRDGKVASWNPAAERIFGWSSSEVVGRMLPANMPSHLRALSRSTKGQSSETERKSTDLHIKRKDGAGLEVATYTARLTSTDSQPDGCIVVVADITARKQIEDELRRAKVAAEAAGNAKSDFLATMSHEIRTPMNGVMGMAQLLMTTQLDAEQRDYTRTIYKSGEALLAIINDILDFSKIEAGMMTIEPIPFDLLTAVSGVIELLASRAEAKGLELICRFAPDLDSALIGDAGRIRQILTNLVGNAVKFTAKGHVYIEVVTCSLPFGVPGIRFAIHDTGIGIPSDKQHLLFEKFTQADSSTTRKFGGTGLGLAISKQLAELMGGHITVQSEVGHGSTFVFEVPLARDPDPPAKVMPATDLTGVQVVVAEGNTIIRKVIEEMLRGWGCIPFSVETGDQALTALKSLGDASSKRVVCIVDAHLPDMDAYVLGQRLHGVPGCAHVPLILLTTMGQRGDSQRAAAAGYHAYLTKPVLMSDLRDSLATLAADARDARGARGAHGADSTKGTAVDPNNPKPMVTRHSLAEARGNLASGLRRNAVKKITMPQAKPKVLLVEDDEAHGQWLQRALKQLGCTVIVVTDGAEAVTQCLNSYCDLVLMESHLLIKDGVAAVRIIRNRESERRTPILAMCTNPQEQEHAQFLAAGMDGVLAKPVQSEDLTAVVAQWIMARRGITPTDEKR